MKTPREILFARHENVTPKLDAIRREIVTGLNHQDTKALSRLPLLVTWWFGGFRKIWEELYFPSRRIWAGLAAVWILILITNISQRDNPAHIANERLSAAGPTMSLQAQQRWLNELLADRAINPAADRARNFSPKPRTEKTETTAV